MAIRLGMEAKLYYDPAGLGGVPSWTELTNVKDVTLNLETGEADVTTRGNAGWRATVGTLRDGSIEFEMVWDTADPGFTAIKDAYFNNAKIAFAVMDGDIGTPGSQGLQADFSITNFSRNEALEEAIMVSVTAKPTYSTVAPSWVTV
ncbi:MAG: phage tail tube protein [Planctomycetota bacterium]